MEHEVAALDVLYFLEDEGDEADDEFVNELLLLLHVRDGSLQMIANLLEYQVEFMIEQPQFELSLGWSLQQLDYDLVRDYRELEVVGGVDVVEVVQPRPREWYVHLEFIVLVV